MKKILTLTAAFMFATANAFAASVGFSGTALYYSADGTETTKSSSEKNSKSDSGVAPMLSIFLEEQLGNGATVGVEVMPYSAKVGSGSMSKDDDAETSGTNTVDVNFKNHITLYVEYPHDFTDGGFFKAGVHTVTVETDDSLSTGSKYGDDDLQGLMIGIGKKGDTGNGGFFKITGELSYYEGGTFNAATGGNAVGDSAVFNKVDLDELITAGVKVSVGF